MDISLITGNTPNSGECRTERLAEQLFICLYNKTDCMYAFQANNTRSYCFHKNNYKLNM